MTTENKLEKVIKDMIDKYKKLWRLYYEDEFSILHKIDVVSDLKILLTNQPIPDGQS